MRHMIVVFAMVASVNCFALNQFDGPTGADKTEQDGPSMPGGNQSDWAYQVVRNRRGPTGSCPDPNPRPDKQPQGIIVSLHTSEPNGPDGPMTGQGDKGPRGMSREYYAALTNDHYAGPSGPA
jgi:hypothetical protein